MHNIEIICIGSLKETYLREACAEYLKRLTPYARVSVIEIKEGRLAKGASAAEEEIAKGAEGTAILSALNSQSSCARGGEASGTYVIALDICGRRFSSEGFADWIGQVGTRGQSHLAFVIGGSTGLAPSILARADLRLSFSDMTFPHQLMRVILLEQIYRAFRIRRGEPYHK
ncbi:ribosomal RNA large subunit methyltransferase H [Clostridia bacterium]|nr:ribosomal RNA large subunit methyltransferase H [Clostridia bacterium]